MHFYFYLFFWLNIHLNNLMFTFSWLFMEQYVFRGCGGLTTPGGGITSAVGAEEAEFDATWIIISHHCHPQQINSRASFFLHREIKRQKAGSWKQIKTIKVERKDSKEMLEKKNDKAKAKRRINPCFAFGVFFLSSWSNEEFRMNINKIHKLIVSLSSLLSLNLSQKCKGS